MVVMKDYHFLMEINSKMFKYKNKITLKEITKSIKLFCKVYYCIM